MLALLGFAGFCLSDVIILEEEVCDLSLGIIIAVKKELQLELNHVCLFNENRTSFPGLLP